MAIFDVAVILILLLGFIFVLKYFKERRRDKLAEKKRVLKLAYKSLSSNDPDEIEIVLESCWNDLPKGLRNHMESKKNDLIISSSISQLKSKE